MLPEIPGYLEKAWALKTIERQKKTIKTLKQRLAFVTSVRETQLHCASIIAKTQ